MLDLQVDESLGRLCELLV